MNAMNRGKPKNSLVLLIVLALIIALPVAVSADTPDNSTNVTGGATPQVTTLIVSTAATIQAETNMTKTVDTSNATEVPVSPSSTVGAAPVLVFTNQEILNLSAYVSGYAKPGTDNTTIEEILWNWGDGTATEIHGFPNNHTYGLPGNYNLSITVMQNDGLEVTNNTLLRIQGYQPTVPVTTSEIIPSVTTIVVPTPVVLTPKSPVITLFSPLIEGTNVTLNGLVSPGDGNTTIQGIIIDWDDGRSGNYTRLPANHQYTKAGTYEISITGIQSDGQSTSKSIVFEVQDFSSVNVTPSGTTNTGGSTGVTDQTMFLTGIIVVLVIVMSGGIIWRALRRRREDKSNLLPKPVTRMTEAYYRAKEEGNLVEASEYAHSSARMFRSLAESAPEKRATYLEKAALWETIAGTIGKTTAEKEGAQNAPSPLKDLSDDDYREICSGTDVRPEVLASVVRVALELAREGREGKPVGTAFIVGDTPEVMKNSKQFVLNPFYGHQESERRITDATLRENVKEFAQLDGAFIATGDGLVEAAGRYITVDTSQVQIPKGMGSRHASVAGITQVTKSIGVVVSQSGGVIKVIKGGRILRTLSP